MCRGSFTESFPLLGYDLRDYDVLFEEKVNLFAELLKEKPVTWEGSTRASLDKSDVFPKTETGLTTYVGVGGSPQSVIRTARYGFGLMLAIIGGSPDRFIPYVELYKRASKEFDQKLGPIGVHSPGYITDTEKKRSIKHGQLTKSITTASAATAAGRHYHASNSSTRSNTARSASAHLKLSREKSLTRYRF